MELFYGSGSDNSKLDSLRGGSESGFLEYPCYYLKNYGKIEYTNITFSKAARKDNSITGQTASQQVLYYLNVHLSGTIMSIQ